MTEQSKAEEVGYRGTEIVVHFSIKRHCFNFIASNIIKLEVSIAVNFSSASLVHTWSSHP